MGVSSVHHSVGEVRNRSIVCLGQEQPLRGLRFFEKAITAEVKSLSDNRCGGRPMTSISVEPDGSVHVQC